MAEYRKSEAREWARAKMRGVANVIIPTFTQNHRNAALQDIEHRPPQHPRAFHHHLRHALGGQPDPQLP
jgi:hypothetical protein